MWCVVLTFIVIGNYNFSVLVFCSQRFPCQDPPVIQHIYWALATSWSTDSHQTTGMNNVHPILHRLSCCGTPPQLRCLVFVVPLCICSHKHGGCLPSPGGDHKSLFLSSQGVCLLIQFAFFSVIVLWYFCIWTALTLSDMTVLRWLITFFSSCPVTCSQQTHYTTVHVFQWWHHFSEQSQQVLSKEQF